VLVEVRDDRPWDRDCPDPGIGRGRAEHERPVGQLLVLLDDGDGAMQEVEVTCP
jgi:hypothetical protein